MKHKYIRKNSTTIVTAIFSFFTLYQAVGQVHNNIIPRSSASHYNAQPSSVLRPNGEKMEELYSEYLALDVLDKVADSVQATPDERTQFSQFYRDKISGDRSEFFKAYANGTIKDITGVKQFAVEKQNEYAGLYAQFRNTERNYPSTINEYTSRTVAPVLTPIACQAACSNIDFENGTLSSWFAYYANNTSTTSGYSQSGQTGGACGAVTQSGGPDVNISATDYQVEIMSGGNDPIAGPFLPRVCPTGGNYSVRIGDSTRNGAQIGILEQKFTVTAANENFQFMYAVVLENPSHNYYEQPYFNVQVLDHNGNQIPGCGNYSVVSGPGLPGYRSFYYSPDGDTVYVKPWTTVYLPLKNYIGTCVTVEVTVADCSLGGHFGYAYFDADCSVGVIGSSPVICGNNVTLTAPAGGAAYKWMGPCIVGPSTNQTCSVSCAGTYSVVMTSSAGPTCTDTLTISVAASTSPAPVISSVTEVPCHGGATGGASVSVTGGTTPYTYTWTPSGGNGATATNLTAGTYTCTVKDVNGCTGSVSVVITQPPVLTAVMGAPTDVKCNGAATGGATVTAGGGTPAYTYSWSPSGGTNALATNLTAGTYTCTVTDKNGCIATATAVITQPPALTASISSSTGVSCHGGSNGSATVTAGGGTPAYTYAWSPSGGTNATANNLTAGSYTVTVTDHNNCIVTTSVTIAQPPVLTATISSSTNILCNGGATGNATVTAGGGTSPYAYAWAPSGGNAATANNLVAGSYTVTVTDHDGCTATASVILTQPTALGVSTGSTTGVSCNGGNNGSSTATATGGTSPYNYSWAPSGGNANIAVNLTAGTYTVTATDNNGCTATATAVITQPATLTANITATTNVKCNGAATGSATVTAGGGTTAYTYAWTPSGGNGATANGLTAGAYTITVTDANGCLATATTTLTQPTAITIVTSFTAATCGNSNGSASAAPSGGTGAYTYAWAPVGGTNATAPGLSAGSYTVTVHDANNCSVSAAVSVPNSTGPTVSISSSTNELCHGGATGSATGLASGGTPPYTYSWSPSGGNAATANGLTAGTYTINVTDHNGCVGTASVTITQPLAITVVINPVVEVKCHGGATGSATANPSGGTGTYTYAWTPSGGANATANGLTAGAYTVTVHDANACTGTATVTITQPTALGGTITHTNVSCHGGTNGSATVTATGGTPAYTYLWSPSGGTNATANGLTAGTYTLTGTDANGCIVTVSVTITQPALLGVTTGSIVEVTCHGLTDGSATATGTGGTTPYTYAWAPSGGTSATANNLGAGTYTITLTDKKGCIATATAVITQPALLTAGITASTNVSCNGASDGTATVTANGGTTAYTYLWSPIGQTNATATGLAPGSYTATVTDAHGCTATASVAITQPTVLTANITATTNVSCSGLNNGSLTVSAGGGTVTYTYAWSPSGGTNATANNLTAGIYTVTVTDADHCSVQATGTITQPPVLTVAINASTNVSCNGGNNGSATASAGGGTTAYNYAWTPSGGNAATANNLTAGTYTVTVTDAHLCTATASIIITQPTQLVTSISAFTNVSCNGGFNGSATVTANGGTPGYNYLWTGGGGTNQTAVNLIATTYTVTVTDNNGCSSTSSVTIGQPNALSATTATAQSTCGANNGSASVNVTGGTPGYNYVWSPSGATSDTATGLLSGTYQVMITDGNGCIDSAQAIVNDAGAGVAGIKKNISVTCNGGNNGMGIAKITGGSSPFTYLWSNGATSDTASGLTAGVYTVTITDVHGCKSSISDTILQPTALILDPSVTKATCGLSNGSIIVNVSGATPTYTYNWSTGGTTNTVVGLNSGSYSVVVTDANGCMDTSNVILTNATGANPSITAVTNVTCNGGNNGAATVGVAGGTPPYTYAWTPSGGTTNVATGLTAGSYTCSVTDSNHCLNTAAVVITQPLAIKDTTITQINVTCNGGNGGKAVLLTSGGNDPYTYSWTNGATADSAMNLSAGTYYIAITDSSGCHASDSVLITQPPPIIPNITGKDSICYTDSTILSAGSAMQYLWSTGATTDSITVKPLTTTTYTVYQTNLNCKDSVTFTVNVSLPLSVTMQKVDSICFGNTLQIAALVTGGKPNYNYIWNNGITSDSPGPFTVTPAGPTYYICTVTDACGASKTDSTEVVGSQGPKASFVPTPDTALGGQIIAFVNTSQGGVSWYWGFGDGSNSVDSFPNHTYQAAGNYIVYLIATSAAGCHDSVAEQVVITQEMIVPNVFTPNGDGINDVFHVKAGGMLTYSISIYNRWGEEVFSANDPNIDWTGRTNAGVEASVGTYFYKINATAVGGQTYNLTGYLQLLR